MKTKLEMAHEYLLRFSGATVADAWAYVDAMQAEMDKRENKDQPKVSNMADSPELDDCDHHWKELQDYKICKICNKKQGYIPWDKWQPDWSQAPEWANFIVMSKAGTSYWHANEPKASGNGWVGGGLCDLAYMGFYHKGDWRDSLRKRPE